MAGIIIKTKTEAYDVLPPKISDNSFLGDVLTSGEEDPITAGFFKVVPGEPLVYKYPYDEFKIVQEVKGDFIVSDDAGNVTHPKAGDVIFLPKGVTVTFKVEGDADSYAYNFYVGKKALNQL
jgi:ethanolamine utilization protein EutQ (cupin superfamily)